MTMTTCPHCNKAQLNRGIFQSPSDSPQPNQGWFIGTRCPQCKVVERVSRFYRRRIDAARALHLKTARAKIARKKAKREAAIEAAMAQQPRPCETDSDVKFDDEPKFWDDGEE